MRALLFLIPPVTLVGLPIAARLMKAYLKSCAELQRKEAELEEVEKSIDGPTMAYFKKDAASRGGERYRPKERQGECTGPTTYHLPSVHMSSSQVLREPLFSMQSSRQRNKQVARELWPSPLKIARHSPCLSSTDWILRKRGRPSFAPETRN